jgi:hypothetical protein
VRSPTRLRHQRIEIGQHWHLRRLLRRLRAALPFPPHALPPYAFAQHLLAALAETPLEVYLARRVG